MLQQAGERALPDGERFSLGAAATPDHVPEFRDAAQAFAEHHGVARSDDVALAISEALTNAVLHAYRDGTAGPLRLTGWREPSTVCFLVEDDGCGLTPHRHSPGLGRGLNIIAQLCERYAIRGGAGAGTEVWMAFAVRPDCAATAPRTR